MKRFFAFCLAAATALTTFAQTPQPPEIAARNYILLDLNSQQVLAEREADAQTDPASLTKLMTAYLVFAAIRDKKLTLEQTLPVSQRAWAERKGGGSLDAFVGMMNKQAQAWGLKNTQFRNVTGLTETGHYASARDVATIASKIITDFPEFDPLYSVRQFTYNKIKQDNRNLLLGRDPTVDGMKTGYTDAAGYCLVASAVRDMPNGKRRLVSVVLGTSSREARAAESQKLLNWGFQAWDAVRLFEAGKPIATVPVWKGKTPEAQLGAPGALFVTVPKGEGDKLKTQIERTDPLVAPLTQGQQVGQIKVTTAAGTPVANVPLVVMQPVELAGLIGRAWDALRLWIK